MKTLCYSLSIVWLIIALILAQFGTISTYASEYRYVTTITVGQLSVDLFQDYETVCPKDAKYEYCHLPVNTELFAVYWGFRG